VVLPVRRRPRAALGAVALAVVLTSCASSGDRTAEPSRTGSSTSAAAPTTTPPPPPPPVLWPLTGVPAQGPVDRPALAVKIENSIDARPQTGLGAADVVWEEVVEGGITRFVAVYQSTVPPEIGPVRSVRPMDPAIAAPLHGLMAFSGGQVQYVDAVGAAGLQVLSQDNGSGGFYRSGDRSAPHNVYATPQALWDQADPAHRTSPPPQFVLAATGEQPTAVVLGVPTGLIDLKLSGVSHPSWTWSVPDNAWFRAEGTTPSAEAGGAPMRATNVVVLRVDVVNTAARDPAGNPVPETELVGGGQALVASAGRTLAVTWSKASVADPVVLTAPDGGPVRLVPGNTWVELVPNGGGAVATA
jgi:Protein of unknown function (DUF3048) N-terminal domain/Protein of unknown function (DUF3048) C-terminal domain